MLTLIAKLLAALNSESSPRQIALAIALGMIVGLTPFLSMHNILILLLAFVIRVNLSAFFLCVGAFSGLAFFTSAPFASLGESILNNPAMVDFWTGLYQLSFLKLSHFHHTLTLGSLVASLVLFLPLLFISKFLIERYRHHMKAFVEKFKIVRTLKSSRLYQLYVSFSGGE
ncbi:MAG: TIGR03546 family protein [Psychrosphaera sp.]|nr:TIGR03546 family protein [Psychrosphaera sp.]